LPLARRGRTLFRGVPGPGDGVLMKGDFVPDCDFHPSADQPWRVLVFYQDRLVIRAQNGEAVLPHPGELGDLTPDLRLGLGMVDGRVYGGWSLGQAPELPNGLRMEGLRALFGRLGETEFQLAGYALQLLNWLADNRHCGRCGEAMVLEKGDRALVCSVCRHTVYPRISPAIIVAVTSGNRLLLGRSGRFPGRRMFSVVAGYVEPGETLEDCVRREVREEVGLEVRRIRYFGSQAWPFSGALMVGFTAEHAAGSIRVDGNEILEAGWFAPDRLPEIPGKISIARQLIDWFVDQYR
jgi:NAD+ diphosphatase